MPGHVAPRPTARYTIAAVLVVEVLLSLLPSEGGPVTRSLTTGNGKGNHVVDQTTPAPPVFPDSYQMSFNLSIPYLSLIQPQGLSYPIEVWYDNASRSIRIEVKGGLDTIVYTKGVQYSVMPRIDKEHCRVFTNASEEYLLGRGALPDLKDWVFIGKSLLNGREANVWQHQIRQWQKTSSYTMHVDALSGAPLKLQSLGVDVFTDSHFDEYIHDFTAFKPGPVNSKVFDAPTLCAGPESEVSGEPSYLGLQLGAMLPASRGKTDVVLNYHWSQAFERFHNTTERYGQKLQAFIKNRATVHKMMNDVAEEGVHSKDAMRFKMNQFADWSHEEYLNVMLPKRRRRTNGNYVRDKSKFQPLGVFRSRLSKSDLPTHLDWRGTPADSGVRDQAQCGSCFAFAAVGTLEASWFMATGDARQFSEQQGMDCSWGYLNNFSCDGGDYQPVIQYVADHQGIASLADYPYAGIFDYCRDKNVTKSGFFKGYMEIPSRDETAVMEALFRYGPLAISVDAEADSFEFYSEGIYKHKSCQTADAKLDHAVVLVGYGTSNDGTDYWIVKNTWSKFWGQDGYIKIDRAHDCGVTTDAVYAVVADEYVKPGIADRIRERYSIGSSEQRLKLQMA